MRRATGLPGIRAATSSVAPSCGISPSRFGTRTAHQPVQAADGSGVRPPVPGLGRREPVGDRAAVLGERLHALLPPRGELLERCTQPVVPGRGPDAVETPDLDLVDGGAHAPGRPAQRLEVDRVSARHDREAGTTTGSPGAVPEERLTSTSVQVAPSST
ncbi:hypothetical protein [Actinomycetospora sp. NBC_00405]|uniref:hypothetical protein n=1 Tax=Actinomycetospora sp. NBC_00405 TaxID=2975952 RepID=UPI002E1D6C6D